MRAILLAAIAIAAFSTTMRLSSRLRGAKARSGRASGSCRLSLCYRERRTGSSLRIKAKSNCLNSAYFDHAAIASSSHRGVAAGQCPLLG